MGEGERETAIARLRAFVAEARVIVPFTGAGISTECGIPDFRSPGGFWSKYQPIQFADFMASQAMRDEAWRRRFATEPHFAAAQPGRGHQAIAMLYRRGKIPAVITQNIDNLHQNSGVAAGDVIELHGNATYALCMGCARRYEIDWVRKRFDESGGGAPSCCDCGGPIKTATVSFGQAMPEHEMQRALEWAERCDLLIAIGSSLVVWPAAGIPMVAKRAGARLVIINREPTDFDNEADLVIHDDIGATLVSFVDA
jgi:NAD-dependent deacetylase